MKKCLKFTTHSCVHIVDVTTQIADLLLQELTCVRVGSLNGCEIRIQCFPQFASKHALILDIKNSY